MYVIAIEIGERGRRLEKPMTGTKLLHTWRVVVGPNCIQLDSSEFEAETKPNIFSPN